MSNPYQPPVAGSTPAASPHVDYAYLKNVAWAQRGVMLTILTIFVVAGLNAALHFPPTVALLLMAVVGFASLGFGIRLGWLVYGGVGAVITAVFLLLPGVVNVTAPQLGPFATLAYLVTLLVVNQGATKKLRAAGFRVGLLGGSPAEVEARMRGS
jgi:hypothetical protein